MPRGISLLVIAVFSNARAWAQEAAVGPERLDLAQALTRALARNPDVLTAADEVRRVEGLLIETRAASVPNLFATGEYIRLDSDRAFGGMVTTPADQVTADAALSVPLVVPPRWADWSHAVDDRRIAQLSLAEVRRNVAIAVGHAYLAVLARRNVLQANQAARDAARAHADYAQKQFEEGAGNRLDAARSAEQWRIAEAQVQAAAIALVRAQEALGVLVAGDLPVDAAEVPSFVQPGPGEVLNLDRADLRAQRMRVTAADNRVRLSWTDYMPSLIGVWEPQYTDPPTIFQPRHAWQATLTLTVPIFEGGLRHGQHMQRRALLGEARAVLEGDIRQARSDIRLGREEVVRADIRLQEARSAAALAHEALDIAVARYREGATTEIEVIDAQQEARNADLTVAAAENNASESRLDLSAAAGLFP